LEDDRVDEALALAEVAEAHAGDLTTQVRWRTARARVMVRRGRGALAERLIREGVSLAEQTDSTDLRASALVWAADVRREAGRPAEAEPFERRALRLFERRGATAQAAAVAARLQPAAERATPTQQTTAPPVDTAPTPVMEAAAPTQDATSEPVPAAPEGGATRLADEMMAMFSDAKPSQPTTQEPSVAATVDGPGDRAFATEQAVAEEQLVAHEPFDAPEQQSAEIDPADELLHDPMMSAEDGSKRRWFNR
jgi:hypothetical protein